MGNIIERLTILINKSKSSDEPQYASFINHNTIFDNIQDRVNQYEDKILGLEIRWELYQRVTII